MPHFITWLHLSDLHTSKPKNGWRMNKILRLLPLDLAYLEKEHSLKPDFICFTGDCAMGINKGDQDKIMDKQFKDAALFLDIIRKTYRKEIPKSRVFIVPGNHDVNRNKSGDDQSRYLDEAKVDDINKLMANNDYQWSRQMDRIKQYQLFLKAEGYHHLLDDQDVDHGIYTLSVELFPSFKVAISGFNTVWSSSKDKEKGRIWIGAEYQVGNIAKGEIKGDLRIALCHHPFGWLVEEEE
ncbi:MAG: metallophosphoesterase, partial [Anaerolineales bacterium]